MSRGTSGRTPTTSELFYLFVRQCALLRTNSLFLEMRYKNGHHFTSAPKLSEVLTKSEGLYGLLATSRPLFLNEDFTTINRVSTALRRELPQGSLRDACDDVGKTYKKLIKSRTFSQSPFPNFILGDGIIQPSNIDTIKLFSYGEALHADIDHALVLDSMSLANRSYFLDLLIEDIVYYCELAILLADLVRAGWRRGEVPRHSQSQLFI